MPLFQKSVINKYLRGLDHSVVEEAWLRYVDHFLNLDFQNNVRGSKEEQYQAGFLRDLFVNIFGYTLNPDVGFNLTTELKNIRGAKKTDGAILKEGSAIAVIELKGTDTVSLDKIEDQAFGYKRNHPDCRYVITSNFEKLRFYIDDSIDYIDFNLFFLTRDDFQLLWICLHREHIMSDLPGRIKKESITQEEVITKQLYKDYSAFRRQIFDSIIKRNPDHDKLTLFKSTQKLLDRFLFIFFAEDRGLLPPNSIREIIVKWTDLRDKYDEYTPLYDRFRKYFGYLNTGYKGSQHDIFAYNGGLFAPDPLLDTISIDDDILYAHTQKLSDYDFESEISVNILGHIFEHSLNEIEEIQAELDGIELDTSKSKRKKDGVFYTPKYITKYIVDNTVGRLCEEKKTSIGIDDAQYEKGRKNRDKKIVKKLQDQLEEYRAWLLKLTICDPACGSGAFLNQALEYLIAEHQYLDTLQTKLLGGLATFPNVENSILENNLFGVDINQESVEIAKLSLWLRTAQKGRKLTSLNNNIKAGNSLIDDPEVAGDLAFNWQVEFPHVFEKGGFDVVFGNPPYVTKSFNTSQKEYFNHDYESAQYQLDLYILFMEKGIKILNSSGLKSYIVPNSWLKNLMFDKIRKYTLEHLTFLSIIPNLDNVFADASVDTLIFVASKTEQIQLTEIGQFVTSTFEIKHHVDQRRFLLNDKLVFDVEISVELSSIFSKIDSQANRLWEVSDITRGINPYDKYRGQSAEIIANKIYHANHKKDSTFVPEIRGKHVDRYNINWDNASFVSYGDWLAAPREPKYFNGSRIVCRQVLGTNLNCAYLNEEFIIDQSVFIAKFDTDNPINPLFILSQITSKLISFYFRYKANEFDKLFPKIKIGEFRKLPIIKDSPELEPTMVSLTTSIIDYSNKTQSLLNSFINFLQSKHPIEKLSKKLESWHELTFGDFLKELKKKKIKLSLSEEAEWMPYFEEQKAKALDLRQQIDTIDAEIDQMVYQLYGLTDDEIAIVEEAVG